MHACCKSQWLSGAKELTMHPRVHSSVVRPAILPSRFSLRPARSRQSFQTRRIHLCEFLSLHIGCVQWRLPFHVFLSIFFWQNFVPVFLTTFGCSGSAAEVNSAEAEAASRAARSRSRRPATCGSSWRLQQRPAPCDDRESSDPFFSIPIRPIRLEANEWRSA